MTETITTRGQGCDRSLVKAKRFQITIENCSVATGFHGVVLRQGILCRDRVLAKTKGSLVEIKLARTGVFYRDRIFLCHDRVGNAGEALCRDIIFYVAIECGKMKSFCVETKQFYVAT